MIVLQPFQGPPPVQGMSRPQGGPPQVMHNDPRGPRPDWSRPPGKHFIRVLYFFPLQTTA